MKDCKHGGTKWDNTTESSIRDGIKHLDTHDERVFP